MLEPFLELMVNAVDTAATVVVLLALWEGRRAGSRIRHFFGIRDARATGDVDGFLSEARRSRGKDPFGSALPAAPMDTEPPAGREQES